METMTPSPSREKSFVDLAADVASGARELLAAHADQLKAEVRTEALRVETAFFSLSAGGALMFIGVAFLLIAIVMALQTQFGLSPGFAWGLVGGLAIVGGLVAVYFARQQLRAVHVVPEKTLHSLEESLSWVTTR